MRSSLSRRISVEATYQPSTFRGEKLVSSPFIHAVVQRTRNVSYPGTHASQRNGSLKISIKVHWHCGLVLCTGHYLMKESRCRLKTMISPTQGFKSIHRLGTVMSVVSISV